MKKFDEVIGPRTARVSEDTRVGLRDRVGLTFSFWRPFRNPSRLIQIGMSETEVEAIAGKPDDKDFYTGNREGQFIAIAGWYYKKGPGTEEVTLLEFEIRTGRLIRIVSKP